jgi:hypothetical protein
MKNKKQQGIYAIPNKVKSLFSKFISWVLHIYPNVGGQFKKRQKRAYNDSNIYSLSKLRKTSQTDKELLNKVQNVLTDIFNGQITIDKETRFELINFIEDYHRKYDNVSMTMKAITIEDKSIQNKN